MNQSEAAHSAAFVGKFAEMAGRISGIGFSVESLQIEYGAFGSWKMVVVRRHHAYRFIFDGRDAFLTIESARFTNNSRISDWREVETFVASRDSISETEKFLRSTV
jgi:hypothetical protein